MPSRPTYAVVLAAGVGARLGAERPKQLLELAGKTVLERSVAPFVVCDSINEVLVMTRAADLEVIRAIVEPLGVTRILAGGVERHDTVRVAIEALGDADANVLFHDAARPLVSATLIDATVAALQTHGAAGAYIESTDTVVQVTADGATVDHVLERPLVRRAQTPQGFRLDVIRAAHEQAAADPGFAPTDDCGVVARYLPDEPIAVVPGDPRNLKVTEPGDLAIAELWLAQS